jgi:hypothetical protein
MRHMQECMPQRGGNNHMSKIIIYQGALLKNRPLDPRKTFDSPSGSWFIVI